ncbi:MAG: ubiquitin-like small modifier protein 1 [Anaerolineales bacterium]|jgi:molybdopterin converting factor small subunit
MATVKLFGNLRKQADRSNLQVTGSNVRTVIETLCQNKPSIGDLLLEDGEIRPHFIITLNGHDINLAAGLDTVVGQEDQIAIFSPIAGG